MEEVNLLSGVLLFGVVMYYLGYLTEKFRQKIEQQEPCEKCGCYACDCLTFGSINLTTNIEENNGK